jgi:hypothetical protein
MGELCFYMIILDWSAGLHGDCIFLDFGVNEARSLSYSFIRNS